MTASGSRGSPTPSSSWREQASYVRTDATVAGFETTLAMTYDPHGRRGVVDRGSCASVAAPVAIAYGTGLLGDDGAADTAPADDGVAPTVRYGEELRANWDVTGVADDDVLNVRDLPGVEGAIIGMLAHDAAELESTGRIATVGEQLWREVVVPGDGVGWVAARYLTETS